MTQKKFLLLFVAILTNLTIIICSDHISNFLIELDIGWTQSRLLPIIAVIGLTIFSSTYLLFKINFSKWLRMISAILLCLTSLLFEFYCNPIYIEDYRSEGLEIKQDEKYNNHEVAKLIAKTNSNYTGLMCIVSKDCGFCHALAPKLETLVNRSKVDVIVIIASSEQDDIDYFKGETDAYSPDYLISGSFKGVLEICDGSFPTIFYMKQGRIIYKWNNNQFGYPAFDWVENGLN